MKKTRKEEVPLLSIERNPIYTIVSASLSALLCFLTFRNLFQREILEINPLSFFLFVPTLVISFQTLWYLLNPYAYIYPDKFEVKKSIFQNEFRHIVDIQKVGEIKNGSFIIHYNDDEMEKIPLFSVRSSDQSKFREEILKLVEGNLKVRP